MDRRQPHLCRALRHRSRHLSRPWRVDRDLRSRRHRAGPPTQRVRGAFADGRVRRVRGEGHPMGRDTLTSRRRLLSFLAASPLLGGPAVFAQELRRLPDPMVWGSRTFDRLIGTPREALVVFDFEAVAHKNLPPAHFGYLASGVDDDLTLRANREGFQKFQLRPRRLVDVGRLDTRMELFGETYGSPIVVAPTGSNRAFHEDGELAVARAARAGNHLTMLSTVA